MAYANQRKLFVLRASARELDSGCSKIMVKRDTTNKKVAKLYDKVKEANQKLQVEIKKRDDKVAKLEGQIDEAKAELEKNSQELAEEMSSARADGVLWVRDTSLQ